MEDEIKSKRITAAITKAKNYWHMLGPGLTTGAADDDPAGITTYTQVGASFGFRYLWTAVITFPFMAIVQEMCARIGLVTGRGLAGSIQKHYRREVIWCIALLLFIANTINIGADLAIMGQVSRLILPFMPPFSMVVILTIVSLFLQVFVNYKDYAQYLKWLALILIAYILAAFNLPIDWQNVIKHTIVPQMGFNSKELFLFAAIVGTTISPYLFFWQTSQEVEEQILGGKTSIKARSAITTVEDIQKMRVDVWSGMFISTIVMFFIIITSAGTLFSQGFTGALDLTSAAMALKPLGGNFAYILFAFGIIGTGMLAIPVMAGSSSYVLSESFGWREGLYRKFRQAHAFYGVIIASMILGIIFNLFHFDPIRLLLYSAVINGIIAPIILVLILDLSSNKKIMGQWANRSMTKFWGWVIVVLMFAVSVAGIVGLVAGV